MAAVVFEVGLFARSVGLGVFDLIITDEAHKSRGTESDLSRLLERVIMPADTARRLALTATPVELDVSQWHSTLSRLGLDATALAQVQEATSQTPMPSSEFGMHGGVAQRRGQPTKSRRVGFRDFVALSTAT